MADSKLYRARFYVNPDDYRPVVWPIDHPYWCSGSTEENSIIVAYIESEKEILRLWPEAINIDMDVEVDGYYFTDRFNRPEWWNPEVLKYPILSELGKDAPESKLDPSRTYHIDGKLPDPASGKIVVFGSNTEGFHSLGMAKECYLKYGAIRYVGEGRQGNSYAIPTRWWDAKIRQMHTLHFETVVENVQKFCQYAIAHPELSFFVTAVGCGYAGFTADKIAPLFKGAINCSFPEEWEVYLED